MVLRAVGGLGADRRSGAAGDLPADARPDGAARPPAGRAPDRALRLPELPQGRELVLQGAQAGPGHPAATGDDRLAGALRVAGRPGRRGDRRSRRGRLARRRVLHPRARRADLALVERATMSDGAALEAYCHENPEDDHAHLVYADWLEEHGDQPRAELVRAQTGRSRLWWGHPEYDRLFQREKELLEEHKERWLADVPVKFRPRVTFTRGLRRLRITATQLIKSGRSLFRSARFDSLWLENVAGRMPRLLRTGLLAGVRRLDLSYAKLTGDDALALAGCADLAGVRSLDLGCNELPDD